MPGANGLAGGLQNGTCHTSVILEERAPQNDCHQCLFSQGVFQLPPASPGGLPRSASGSDPGSFQITVLCWGL